MGFFSWMTVDTNESISNKFSERGALPVKMIDDKNNIYIETDYEGYGVFGGVDFYSLLDKMNGGTGDRVTGIGKEFGFDIKRPKIVSITCKKKWEELEDNVDCEYQGYFYPIEWWNRRFSDIKKTNDEDEELTNIREIIEANKGNENCEEFQITFNHTYLKDKNFEKLKKKFCLKLKEIIGIDNFNHIISNENEFDNCLKNVRRECNICFLFAVKKKDRKDTDIYINVFNVFEEHFEELIEEGK